MRALLVVAAILVSHPVVAQTVPDPSEYYFAKAAISCQGPGRTCTLSFLAVATPTLVTRVSCVITTSGTLRTVEVEDVSRPPLVRQSEPLAINTEPVIFQGNNWYSVNWSVDFLLAAGGRPAIAIETFPAGSNQLSCTLIGRKS
jgi:hypothetical protein